MIDADILLLAIVNMAEGVKNLIGDKGAKAVMRDAGKQAGPKLLESLIGHFPETLVVVLPTPVGPRSVITLKPSSGKFSTSFMFLLKPSIRDSMAKEEALRRSCIILEDLGFAKSIRMEGDKVIVEEDIFTDAIVGNDLINSPVVYFFAGLIEGFVSFMSDQRVVLVPEEVQRGKIVYKYNG